MQANSDIIPSSNTTFKYLSSGYVTSYYCLAIIGTPEKSLVMDYISDDYSNGGSGQPFYNGGLIDTMKKVYAEEGVVGLFVSKKGILTNIIYIGSQFAYAFAFQNKFQPFKESDRVFVRLGALAFDNCLFSIVYHPVALVSLASHKKYDDKTKEKGAIGTAKQIYAEKGVRGFYNGVGLTCLQLILENSYMFGIHKVVCSGLEFILGSELGSLNDVLRDSVEQVTSKIIFDVTSHPFSCPLQRYIGDQGKNYSSYIDCVKKTYNQEGWKGLYKGSWIGLLMK